MTLRNEEKRWLWRTFVGAVCFLIFGLLPVPIAIGIGACAILLGYVVEARLGWDTSND